MDEGLASQVVLFVSEHGGPVTASDVLERFARGGDGQHDVMFAIQRGLDTGALALNREMDLVIAGPETDKER